MQFSKIYLIIFNYVYICGSEYKYVQMSSLDILRARVIHSAWILEIELKSSAKVIHALSHKATSSAPI